MPSSKSNLKKSKLTHELHFDFSHLRIGTATLESGPTGCTVFHFPRGAAAAVDVRGGSAALRESTLLDPLSTWAGIDALVLAGGSTYGLEAASGVMQALLESRAHSTHFNDIPSVPAAVVYDFFGRDSSVYPDAALGRRGFESARENVIQTGRVGAGRNVAVGKVFGRTGSEPGGQGAAFRITPSGYRLLAVTIVNALGNITDLQGRTVRGSRDPHTGERHSPSDIYINPELRKKLSGSKANAEPETGNTTLSCLFTDAPLDRLGLQRIAAMGHTAMARVIEPFHTPYDGDALFAVSVPKDEALSPIDRTCLIMELGTLGGRLLCEAVLNGVGEA